MKRLAIALAALLAVSACATTPRNDRAWDSYLAPLSHVETDQARFTVSPVRDWRYAKAGPATRNMRAEGFAVEDLTGLYFVVEPHPGLKAAAHTFLLFEFKGERLLGVTVEARREDNETYSAWRGLWNAYELSYVWGTARDLLTRRAVHLEHEVYVYPIKASEAAKKRVLRHMLARTQALETQPRFYNTWSSNCTNELAKATDISWRPAFVLTGGADSALFKLGLIEGESFKAAKARARFTEWVRAHNDASQEAEAFDAALLAQLRQ